MEKEFPIIKGKKMIMKYNNGNKIHQSFYANNIINTKKKNEKFGSQVQKVKAVLS